jgi:hypothetical protein
LLSVIPVIALLNSFDGFVRAVFPLAFVISREKLFFICRQIPAGVTQIYFSHLYESNNMQEKLLSITPAGIAIGASMITVVVRPSGMAVPWSSLKPSVAQGLAELSPIMIDDLAGQKSAAHQHIRIQPNVSPVFVRMRYLENQIWLEAIPAEVVLRACHSLAITLQDDGFNDAGFQAIGYLRALRISKSRRPICGGSHPVVTALFLLASDKVAAYSCAPDATGIKAGLEMFSAHHVLEGVRSRSTSFSKGSKEPKEPRATSKTTQRSKNKPRRLALLYGRPRISDRPLAGDGLNNHANKMSSSTAEQLSLSFHDGLDTFRNLGSSQESAAQHA